MRDSGHRHTGEQVRYYQVDWANEKFPERQKMLYDWKELTRGMSTDELIKLKEQIEKQIFNKLGS